MTAVPSPTKRKVGSNLPALTLEDIGIGFSAGEQFVTDAGAKVNQPSNGKRVGHLKIVFHLAGNILWLSGDDSKHPTNLVTCICCFRKPSDIGRSNDLRWQLTRVEESEDIESIRPIRRQEASQPLRI